MRFQDASIPIGVPSPRPDGTPSSTTMGAALGSGMQGVLVGRFRTDGARYVYWMERAGSAVNVMARDMHNNAAPIVAKSFPNPTDGYYWSDTTATHFRLWRTDKARMDGAAPSTPVKPVGGSDIPGQGGGEAQQQLRGAILPSSPKGRMDNPHAGMRQFEDQRQPNMNEEGGVGAESWVGGRKNTTGYRIETGDGLRPGQKAGRQAARRVAQVANGIAAINRANKRVWEKN